MAISHLPLEERGMSQHCHPPLTFWSPISVRVEQDSETQLNRGAGKQLVWVKPAGGDFGNWKVYKGSLSSVLRILPSRLVFPDFQFSRKTGQREFSMKSHF